jgi:hypothetical protein
MKLRRVLFLAGACALAVFTQSCTSSAERYAAEISGIDSTLASIDSAVAVFGAINEAEVSAALTKMNDQLRASQMRLDQMAEVDSATAYLFAEYTRARRMVKDFPKRMRTLPGELERTRLQLTGVKEALVQGASEDAIGNKITPEYVKTQYTTEVDMARGLCEELINTEAYARQGMAMYKDFEPKVTQQFELWTSNER